MTAERWRLRGLFLRALCRGLAIMWPILSFFVCVIILLGMIIGWREGWKIHGSLYFSFISGLTIGYGDLVPKTLLTRALAVLIGICGLLVTALIAAVAVKAMTVAMNANGDER